METGSKINKSAPKDHGSSPAKSKKQGPKSPEHKSPEHKLWHAKEQVLSMPSPRREFRECGAMTDLRSTNPPTVCCGPDKKGEGFSRLAVLYFMFFSCVFVLAIVGLRMFTIEDKLLRLDTDYQQQQMRIEALEEKINQLTKKVSAHFSFFILSTVQLWQTVLSEVQWHLKDLA